MQRRHKKSLVHLMLEFIRLNIAGNVLFWGTYGLFFVLETILKWDKTYAFPLASLLAHIPYFFLDKKWVFAEGGARRKTATELRRFFVYVVVSYFINQAIVLGLDEYFAISPYWGQFVAAAFFVVWSYVGLKYWVFRIPPRRTKPKRA